jgi:hypothetical protein
MMMLFQNQNKETLYCVCHITNNEPKTLYLHAKDLGDANAKLIRCWNACELNNESQILAVGPAVGVFERVN